MMKPSELPSQLDRIESLLLQQSSKLDELTRRAPEERGYATKQVKPERLPIQTKTREKVTTFEEAKEKPQVTTDDIIQLLVQTAKKVLELSEIVEVETSQRLREVTCHLLSQLFPSVAPGICDSQLGAQVADCVGQYLGINVADCLENVAYDLEELFRNEISYYQLMNSLNTIPDVKRE